MKTKSKKSLKRIISMILTIIFVISVMQIPTLQKYSGGAKKTYAATKLSDKEIKKLYKNLSTEGKKYFDVILQRDDSLYEYHRKHVNSKYKKIMVSTQSVAILDNLSELNSDLRALNIPFAARYALMAIASGISAAAADGPAPVGDILGIVAALGGFAVLAYNWPKIEKKWSKIEKAFEKCFKNMKTTIKKSFTKIKIKVLNIYYSRTFHNFENHYKSHADEFKDLPGGNGKKPNRNKYYNKARRFMKAKGKDIIESDKIKDSTRRAKFNKKTLEFLIYNKKSKKIITYFLPKHSKYNAQHYSSWAKKALDYALTYIKP